MLELLMFVVVVVVAAGSIVVLSRILVVIFGVPEDDEKRERPKLWGKDLEEWTAIYQSMCIHYQGYIIFEDDVANETWNRWSKLTGKEQWEKKDVSV